jgi:Na+/H+ antiporter NhaD/arsenite permease-like protein
MTVFAVAVFAVAYGLIASEKVHRVKVALGGAALMLGAGVLDFEQAFHERATGVDWEVIFLLLGMMIIVGVLSRTGVFEYVAITAVKKAGGRPYRVMVLLVLITAVASAALDNVTTVLLIAPVTLLVCDRIGVHPVPFLLAEVFASNVGGTSTLIGDPPNIIIAGATELSFNAFIVNLAPIAVLTLVLVIGLLYLLYRPRLQVDVRNRERVMELNARAAIRDPEELRRTVPVLVATVLAFFAHQALHIEPATVALTGAAVCLLVTRQSLEEALARIEWSTLFFFVALFVMVGALDATGAIDDVAQAVKDITGEDRTAELLGIIWVSGVGSAIVDNIPFTTAMIPVVSELQSGNAGDNSYWWALSLGACFGGNATLIAAAANVAAAGLTERAGRPIGFVAFLRIGLPVTAISLLLASGYVALRYILL